MTPPWEALPGRIRIWVRVQPKASRDAVEGLAAGADGRPRLRLAVRAAPDKGAANSAVIGLLSRALGIAKSAVAVDAGATAREKTLSVACGDPAALLDALERLVQEPRP